MHYNQIKIKNKKRKVMKKKKKDNYRELDYGRELN